MCDDQITHVTVAWSLSVQRPNSMTILTWKFSFGRYSGSHEEIKESCDK